MRRRALAALALVAAACQASPPDAQIGAGTREPGPTSSPVDRPAATAPARATTAPRGEPGVLITPSGAVVPIRGRQDGTWIVGTPCGRDAPLSGGTPVWPEVVLDPGHGGRDPGAVSPDGLGEAPVNLAVANHARDALEAAGIRTIVTRTGDYHVELSVRAEIARRAKAAAFVSIHHNAEPDGPWPRPGSETYYQLASPDSKRLAGLIWEEAVAALAPFGADWVADRDAGAKYRTGNRGDYYAMVREPAPVVAVLAELAFMSNPAEAALLARPDVQAAEGRAVARAIQRYLRTPDPGSGFTEPYPRPSPPSSGRYTPPPCHDPPLA